MWRIRLASLQRSKLWLFPRVERELRPNGKWKYYTLLGWYVTEQEAYEAAKKYLGTKGITVSLQRVE